MDTSFSDTNEVDNDEIETYSESALLTNFTFYNSVNPENIRKLMSAPGNCKDSFNKKENRTAFSNEVTMNGKTYREVGQCVASCMTKQCSSSLHSLEYRGAISGVAGSNARVIETHTNRKVYVRNMCNHEITAI